MRQPRSAKANPFPYRGSLVCYLSLDAAGSLTQVGHDFSSAAEAYRRAAAGEIRPPFFSALRFSGIRIANSSPSFSIFSLICAHV